MNPEIIFGLKSVVLFLIGTIILYYSSETIINHSLLIAKKYNISKLFVGVVILAFGTSLPELFVSIIASIKGNDAIVIGNIVGSNIANLGLVFGISLILKTIVFENSKSDYFFNLSALFVSTFVFLYFLISNELNQMEGYFLLLLCFLYFFVLTKFYSKEISQSSEEFKGNILKSFLFLFLSFIMLYLGSDAFIDGSLGIARLIGLNDLAVGMTIISIGTSAPEIFTIISAFKKGENNLIIGNVLGSNIINVLLVGGFIASINSIMINFNNMLNQSIILLFLTLLFILTIILLKKIGKFIGVIFISIYFIFIYLNFITAN